MKNKKLRQLLLKIENLDQERPDFLIHDLTEELSQAHGAYNFGCNNCECNGTMNEVCNNDGCTGGFNFLCTSNPIN